LENSGFHNTKVKGFKNVVGEGKKISIKVTQAIFWTTQGYYYYYYYYYYHHKRLGNEGMKI
jgi:hypothetical protein